MKHITALVLALCVGTGSITGCATLSGVSHDAEESADNAVAKLQLAIKFVRSEVQPYAQEAVALCAKVDPDAAVCRKLDAYAGALETALQHAEQAVVDYRTGKIALDVAVGLVEQAINAAEDYARQVYETHRSEI